MQIIHSIQLHSGSNEENLPGFTPEFPYIASRAELDHYREFFVPWHWHKAVELFYMESGEIRYHTPGGTELFPAGTGGMVNSNVLHMTQMLSRTEENIQYLHIFDPVLISGALAGETCLEKAVGIAAMVKTQKLPMQEIAAHLTTDLGTDVKVAGVEAVMASLGALTTPGTKLPLAILDMGGGSTDAAIIDESGHVNLTHQAGAGELVSMLIQTELGLSDRHIAEEIKKYPLAKVESLFHMRMENGQMTFVDESIDPRFFGRVVLLTENGLVRIEEEIPMEKIVQVRREAKRKVFVTNAFRALKKVAPDHNLRNISTVVLVGGSAEDFEIPEMLMEAFTDYRIVCGRGNIRGTEGPRNAVATGLVLSYIGEMEG